MYGGTVLYANDAFDGLHFMQEIVTNGKSAVPGVRPAPKAAAVPAGGNGEDDDVGSLSGLEAKIALAPKSEGRQESRAVAGASIPNPPFFGSKVVEEIPVDDVYAFINEVALIRGQWQVRKQKLSDAAYEAMVQEKVYPDLVRLKGGAGTKAPRAEGGVWLFPMSIGWQRPYRLPPEGCNDPVSVEHPIGRSCRATEVRFTFRGSQGARLHRSYFAPKNSAAWTS
jgi:cobalamin-dependent methionine synthase I